MYCECGRKITHGKSKSSEYSTWSGMKNRCNNPNSTSYENYGGRGITVCDRWLESFENFYEDMGDRPLCNMSIERVNNDKGYSKDNCIWANRKTQTMNKRINKKNKSGVPGVSFAKKTSRWIARISFGFKIIHLGTFKELDDAIQARLIAEKKYAQKKQEWWEKNASVY